MLLVPKRKKDIFLNCLNRAICALSLSFLLVFSSCFSTQVVKRVEEKSLPSREFDIAYDLYLKGQWEKSATAFKSFIERYPHSSLHDNALFWLGSINIHARDYADALVHLQRIPQDFPASDVLPEANKVIGVCHFHLIAYDRAIAAYQQALTTWGERKNRGDIYVLLADSYFKLENKVEALEALEHSLSGFPQKDQPILRRIRRVIFEELRPQEVVHVLESSSNPLITGYASYRLAHIYFQAKDYLAARNPLEYLLSIPPRHEYWERVNLLLKKIDEQEKVLIQAERSRLGCLLPLSGKNAALGRKLLQGVQLAILNDGYLEGGRPFKLIVRDSHGEPQQAMAALEELAAEEKVIAVLGPALPEILAEVLPLARRYHLPMLSPSALVPPLSMGTRPYAFSSSLNDQDEGEAISSYAVRALGAKTLAILYPASPYGIQLKDIFLREVEHVGGQVVAVEVYDPEDQNLSLQAQRLKEILDGIGFQALFLPDFFPRLGVVLPQLAFYELRVPLLGCRGWHSPLLKDMGNGYAEGAVFATRFFVDSPEPMVQKFVEDFRRTFGEEPGYPAAQAYDAAEILFRALQEGVRTRDQLRNELLQIRDFQGVSGLTSIGSNGQAVKRPILLIVNEGEVFQLMNE